MFVRDWQVYVCCPTWQSFAPDYSLWQVITTKRIRMNVLRDVLSNQNRFTNKPISVCFHLNTFLWNPCFNIHWLGFCYVRRSRHDRPIMNDFSLPIGEQVDKWSRSVVFVFKQSSGIGSDQNNKKLTDLIGDQKMLVLTAYPPGFCEKITFGMGVEKRMWWLFSPCSLRSSSFNRHHHSLLNNPLLLIH